MGRLVGSEAKCTKLAGFTLCGLCGFGDCVLEGHIYIGFGVLEDWKFVGVGEGCWTCVISYKEGSGEGYWLSW
jgi:hypothetical protein